VVVPVPGERSWRWPDAFDALRRGDDCPMCAAEGAAETPHGVRVFEGRWCDGYLSRYPMRAGYTVVIWKGRHVTEPGELSAEEAAGFWTEVAQVAGAIDAEYRPVKMNWLHLGNGVPHLHVHVVPRPTEDVRAGGPLEEGAFNQAETPALDDARLAAEAAALRERLVG
jgi:diadenosine tetraphosphate (Ap4A) HIT family hydrolase